jgi:hypothetical protein
MEYAVLTAYNVIKRRFIFMRKAGAFLLFLLINFTLLYAQENETPPEDAPGGDYDLYNSGPYSLGDQTFIISAGTVFPTVFFNNGTYYKNNNFSPPLGGAGSLSYNYYFTNNIFLGGELGGSFMPTLGNNMYYGVLLGARMGYQFYFWRLEFPLNISVGMIWHRYLNFKNYGFFIKGGGAAYFRYNSEWSFGIHTNWYWLPQYTSEHSKNVTGNMIDILLSARYHF